MSYVLWGLATLAGLWLLLHVVGFFRGRFLPLETVGNEYINGRLRAQGVPRALLPDSVRGHMLYLGQAAASFQAGNQLAKRRAFKGALDIETFKFALWLKEPDHPRLGKAEDGLSIFEVRGGFGEHPEIPEATRTRITPTLPSL